MGKKWSNNEVFLIIDFYDFLKKKDSMQHDGFILYYYNELHNVLPAFIDVSYEDFSRLMKGLINGAISMLKSPDLLGEEHSKYLAGYYSTLRKTILGYASDTKKRHFITDCNEAYLSQIWHVDDESLREESSISISELKADGITEDEINELIGKLITQQEKEAAEKEDDSVEQDREVDTVGVLHEENNKTQFDVEVEEFLVGKNYYQDILFSEKSNFKQVPPPLIYATTLYIISSFIKRGDDRIVIVMPDELNNLMPLIFTQLVSDNMESPFDKFDNLKNVKPGQKMRLGKAVIEVVEITESHFAYKYADGGAVDPWSETWYQYLVVDDSEKLSGVSLLDKEKKRFEYRADRNDIVKRLTSNLGAAKYTSMILATKSISDKWIKKAYVCGIAIERMFVRGVFSKTNGRIETAKSVSMIPNYVVASSMQQMVTAFKSDNHINRIYVASDKVNELLSNQASFLKVLKEQLPVIVFMSDSQYENYCELERYNFVLYHWKPSTLSVSSSFADCEDYKDTMFESVAYKTKNASLAKFHLNLCKDEVLEKYYTQIRDLTKKSDDFDTRFKNMIHRMWILFYDFVYGFYSDEGAGVCGEIINDAKAVRDDWLEQIDSYGIDTRERVDQIIHTIEELVAEERSSKFQELSRALNLCIKNGESAAVILPDKCQYVAELESSYKHEKSVEIFRYRDYLALQKEHYKLFDNVIVIWFGKREYISIKNTYSYKKLIYLIYDFEERWRRAFKKKFDASLSHQKSVSALMTLGFTSDLIAEKPFDDVDVVVKDEQTEESTSFDFSEALKKLYSNGEHPSSKGEELVQCSSVISQNFRVMYLPGHKVLEISELISCGDKVNSKYVKDLKPGDCIVVRNSSKDIIAEKADSIIGPRAESMRKTAGSWIYCLNELIRINGFDTVYSLLQEEDLCSKQQVRYWSMGEVICPENPKVLERIALLCEGYDDPNLKWYSTNFDKVFVTGKELQKYHVMAGRVLTSQLKGRSDRIKEIYRSGGKGTVPGIGSVVIIEVDEVFEQQSVNRARLNKLEAI